ncbi:hypothetical protein [Paenibacillus sp. GCM10027626]|uniref:hypothetical protein n=1 Tax=Paenibacillus sp. GCM10027626 TaxID=3273411 RepID=UPI0036353D63
MRNKLTVKVKHLALFSLALFAAVVSAGALFAEKHPESKMREGGVKAVLAGLAEVSNPAQKWELIREFLIMPGVDSIVRDAEIIIGPGRLFNASGVKSGEREKVTWKEKLPYLEQYAAEAPIDGYLVHAARQLAYYYGYYRQPGDAVLVLEQVEGRLERAREKGKYTQERNELELLRAEWLFRQGDLKAAEQLMTGLLQTGDGRTNAVMHTSVMMKLEQGRLQEALAELEQYLQAAKTTEGNWRSVNEGQLVALQKHLQQAVAAGSEGSGKPASITGTIRRSDGTPIAGAGIFLRYKDDLHHSVMESEPYQTVSGADGRFELRGVLPGSYQFYVGLQFEQIDGYTWPIDLDEWLDVSAGASLSPSIVLASLSEVEYPVNGQKVTGPEVEFQWEPVEGAEYYQLEGTVPVSSGSMGTVIRSYVHDHKVTVSLNELSDAFSGVVYSGKAERIDWTAADPRSLLGFANPESRFSWSVEAYSADGKLLTRSGGYRLDEDTVGNLPFFYLQARTLTAADRLLLDGKHEEALAAYRAAYEKDNADAHSLRMLIRLLSVKERNEADEAAEREIFELRLKLMELAPTPGLLDKLMDYYYGKSDWLKYAEAVEEYKKLSGEPLNPYQQEIYATALMKQGKLDTAAAAFEAAMRLDGSHRFVGNYLAVLLVMNESMEPALAAAAEFPERNAVGTQHDWQQLLARLQKEAAAAQAVEGEGTGYRNEMKQVLDMYVRGDREQLQQWVAAAGKVAVEKQYAALLALAKALLEVG